MLGEAEIGNLIAELMRVIIRTQGSVCVCVCVCVCDGNPYNIYIYICVCMRMCMCYHSTILNRNDIRPACLTNVVLSHKHITCCKIPVQCMHSKKEKE